jgi:hypothetical protein
MGSKRKTERITKDRRNKEQMQERRRGGQKEGVKERNEKTIK